MTAPRPTADAPTQISGLVGTLRRRWLGIAAALVALAFVAVGGLGFSYLFLRPAAPAAVGLSDATSSPSASAGESAASSAASSVAPSATAEAPSSTVAAAGGTGALDGTWTVDPAVGSFSDFSGSFVGYRVEEELVNKGVATAVGRTPDVTGSLTLDGATVAAAEFSADLTSLQSDSSMRDGQLHRQALETDQFPTATFTLTQPIDLGNVPADGQVVDATATGDLTIHGQTRSVEIPLQVRLSGDTVTVTGSLEIVFADYGMSSPNSFMVLSISDRGTMEVQLQLTKA